MSGVTLRNVRKTYPDGTQVLHGVDLEIKDGEFTVFVGPSGCGKTTLLRMIAGLEDITEGEIRIGDTLINEIPPAERGVAMVFQSYALYPHMTVAENMGFALKLAGKSKQEVKTAVGHAAEILQITHLLERKPKALSGGQRQRVAIGRAIVRTPKVFLFDEPLSNLDAALRVQMRIELTKLHNDLGATMIYVTHDQVEAMTMGDRIAVFHKGLVQQYGEPLNLYEAPANRFVAGFLGSPQMNFLPCKLAAKNAETADLNFGVAGRLQIASSSIIGTPTGELALGIRPEHIELTRVGEGLTAKIDILEHLGDSIIVYAKLHGSDTPLAIRLPGEHIDLRAGNDVGMLPKTGRAILFDGQGQSVSK